MHTLGLAPNAIGMSVQGDIGPFTLYTSRRGQIVAFPRSPPLNPPTPTQEHFRDLIRNAAAEWRSLAADQRDDWQQLAWRANLGISGYCLWIWYSRTRRNDSLHVLELQTQITLTRPA